MERILGLDLGTTSLGWAVIEHDSGQNAGKVVAMGVRIFPEGLDEKLAPRNQTRRKERLARRQRHRRQKRRQHLAEKLADFGLLPDVKTPAWGELMALDPYPLRARALLEPLPLHHLGRAIYHLARLRGFASARIADGKKDAAEIKEEGEVKEQIKTLRQKLAGRTLGTFLASVFFFCKI
ncbi:MAG: hypothetical protein HQL73_10765 [Magnetococcales bacterium]|nr:hypothetical protein [Magnetococcales bacterium]